MIRAEVHDDDFKISSMFDATPWFEQASNQEILELAQINWRGGIAADCVAEFFEGRNVGAPHTVDDVFNMISVLDIGYEVSIEPCDAMSWVKKNRPHLMDKIDT